MSEKETHNHYKSELGLYRLLKRLHELHLIHWRNRPSSSNQEEMIDEIEGKIKTCDDRIDYYESLLNE